MANRFWTGTGTWNASNTANWGATTGGTGASVPTAADAVFFDANSTSCTLGANVSALSVNQTGFVGTLVGTGFEIALAGTGTVWTGATGCTSTNVTVKLTDSSATARTIDPKAVTEANSVNFKVSAGTGNFTMLTGTACRNLDFTGSSVAKQAGTTNTFYGDLTNSATMSYVAATNGLVFAKTTGTQTITSNGVTINAPMTVNGVGGTVSLADNLTLGSGKNLTLTNGTFDANGKNVTVSAVNLSAGTKTLTIGSGTWTFTTNCDFNTNRTGLTVSASTGRLKFTSTSAATLALGGFTWPTVEFAGAGPFTIAQANTFRDWAASTATTIRPTASVTQTFTSFSLTGTAGYTVTIDSTVAGTAATLSMPTGYVNAAYMSIKDSRATGGATWNASYSTNVSGNSGWIFYSGAIPGTTAFAGIDSSIQSFLNSRRS